MKALSNLTATPTEADFKPRGTITELHYEDPACAGWFVGLGLTNAGLRFKSRRPESQSVVIPLDELIALARLHAPEVFADEAAITERARAAARANALPGQRPAHPTQP